MQSAKCFDFRERVTTSIIYHFMNCRALNNSISVFIAECGLGQRSSIILEPDILQLFRFNALTSTYKRLHDENSLDPLHGALDHELKSKNRCSLLDLITHFCLSTNEEKSRDAEVQTHSSGPSIRESLDKELAQLRYAINIDDENSISEFRWFL